MNDQRAKGPRRRAWLCASILAATCGTHGVALAGDADQLTPEEQAALGSRMLGRVNLVPRDERLSYCYVPNPTEEQMRWIMQQYLALPPTLSRDRFVTSGNVWTGNGSQGAGGRGLATTLTYSFPDDGPTWGDPAGTRSANGLNAIFEATFGVGNKDRGRELVRQAFGSWRKYTGLTYTEVADNNSALDNSTAHSTVRGDVRIGSVSDAALASQGVLAYNFFPNGGSDMSIIAQQFTGNALQGAANNYRYFRNVVSHEHGHGLGQAHVVPCSGTKLMEPFANTSFDMVQIDDRRGGAYHYGDRFVGNLDANTARDFGDLTVPAVKSIIERNLSTNNRSGNTNTNNDWFKFTISSTQNVVITAAPTGGTYTQGPQSSGCTGTTTSPNTTAVGNLNIELRNNNGATVLQSAASAIAGLNETLTANGLAAGTYWVRIYDSNAAGTDQNAVLQLYDMTIRVGTSLAPPLAIAGVNKRIPANTNCYFMGNINSEATESGATITSYAWDLDANGTFENSLAQPSTTYPSNGLYNVSLRVTDSNGSTDTDTIQVVVFGATTSVTNVSPSTGAPGSSIPVTITGANFRGVTSAAQFTASGTGVTFTGTPVVNGYGTQVTGLSIVIAGNAPLGTRDITVLNSDGQGGTATGTALFNVTGNLPSNDECTGATAWTSGPGSKPFTNNFATDSSPQSFGGTGCTGNLFNDVWYRWTASSNGDVTVTTDSAGAGFSSRVAVYADACPIGAPIQCGEFGVAYNFTATSGTSYLFRVGSAVPNQTGTANVILTTAAATGACCRPDGSCFTGTAAQCSGSNQYSGDFTTCFPTNPCPEPMGACCFASGSCTFVTGASCDAAGGLWQDIGSSCTPNPCAPSTGACCAVDGSCTVTTQAACAANFSGAGTSCSPNNCTQPTGACCSGTTCSISTAATCVGANNSFSGAGSTCNVPGNNTTPCCKANFNQTNGVSVQDIFDFLAAWFSGNPLADFNGTSGVSVQDIFDFLAAWFAGC